MKSYGNKTPQIENETPQNKKNETSLIRNEASQITATTRVYMPFSYIWSLLFYVNIGWNTILSIDTL